MQSLPFEGIRVEGSCAYTTVVHIIVLSVEELGHVFTEKSDIIVLCANQAGKARLALVKAAAWAVGA